MTPPQAFTGLTRTLAASAEPASPPLTLIARDGVAPAFAWIGTLDASLRSSLETQVAALESACTHLRYFPYPKVEEACRRLAEALVARLGGEELSRAGFAAIPNGGHVVLGLLASILGLSRSQLEPARAGGGETPLVVVDDCAISGTRFRAFLGPLRGRRIVFAPLVSPPALRAAIEASEDCVVACVSGEDLGEVSGSLSPDHRERRQARLSDGSCYWIGSTEPLAFPWNEPDRTLWNPVLERYERAWWIVPAELCCKRRPDPAGSRISVQIQPEARGPLRPSHQVLFGDLDGEIVLCSRAEGRVLGLGATGSALWRGLVRGGTVEAAAAEAAGELEAPEAVVRADAGRFVEDLLRRGLLEG